MSEHITAQFMHDNGSITAVQIEGETLEECELKSKLWAGGMRTLESAGKSKRENLFEHIERTSNSPYLEFIHSSPEELAEKLLKASCCYCAYGKDGEMSCNNTEGAHCKEGILAYLTGKTLD